MTVVRVSPPAVGSDRCFPLLSSGRHRTGGDTALTPPGEDREKTVGRRATPCGRWTVALARLRRDALK